ncbi:hypothetical protein [Yersinia proxima]|uniref:hypothetical protein n=1 Tax=Yersinia proxima TaxID=2890316 RepID=UPI001D12539C|nr:hypothetical protein [Yersinia proxima]
MKPDNDICKCECGFTWKRGFSGAHSCEPQYRATIASLKTDLDAALNTCTLIAEALGITGSVAGDTIAKVLQLVSENAAAIEAVGIFSNATEQLTEIIGDEIGMDGVSKLLHGFSIVGSMPATTQAFNYIKAKGVDELAEAFNSWADDSNGDYEAERHWAVASKEALSFAASLRGEQNA